MNGERFRPREFTASFLDESLEPLIEIIGDAGVDAGTARKIVREAQRTPLTDAQMQFLSDALDFKKKLDPYLTNFHQYSAATNTAERARSIFAADDLDEYLGKVLPGQAMGRSNGDFALWYARRTLAFQPATFDHSTKSVLQWIEDMTVEAIEAQTELNLDRSVRPMTNLRRLVGLGNPVAGFKRFEYQLDLDSDSTRESTFGARQRRNSITAR